MSYTLPPEIWELIITEYDLLLLKYIKTIKMIPSRHCIISTVYCQLIQPYIDNLCKLIYPTKCNIINKSYIFNKYNLIDIIEYFDIKIEDLPKINYDSISIKLEYKNKKVRINMNNINYYTDCKLHRIGGPAIIIWYNNQVNIYSSILYYIDNQLHSTDGPAVIRWHRNGNKCDEVYYIDNQLHRINGPAIISWNNNGRISAKKYYINNKKIPWLYYKFKKY